VRSFLRRALDDPADADDLAQETFLAAWSTLGRYRGQASFRSWLCGIAWRKSLTSNRAACPDAALDAARALSALAPDERAAVALCLGADFSHAEAAEALGLPLGTIKSHVQRGRAKLLSVLGGSHE
jgi:RNA polymerase sigma-70 factor (ECF subfamily)